MGVSQRDGQGVLGEDGVMGYLDLTFEEYMEHIDYWNGERCVALPAFAWELGKRYKGVSAREFYEDLFGDFLEPTRARDDYKTGEYGAIALELLAEEVDGKMVRKARRYTVTNDFERLFNLIEHSNEFCLMSAASYAGKARKEERARDLFALVIEIDGIKGREGLAQLEYSWDGRPKNNFRMPKPTYIVCSGNGLHLYYVFEKPLPLWANVKRRLSDVRLFLIKWLWTKAVSESKVEHESLLQAFRIAGTRGKDENVFAMVFRTGEKWTIEKMNEFLPKDLQIEASYKSVLSKGQARELFPDWYKRRVEEGLPPGHYYRHPGIYHDWLEKAKKGATMGHRYWCMENLCSLAVQCQIDPVTVERDLRELAAALEEQTVLASEEEIKQHGHIDENDIMCALRTYHEASRSAFTRRLDVVENKTGIRLERNKRNGRKQKEHLKMARFVRDELNGHKNWQGRPSKQEAVSEWRKANPNGTKYGCAKETGLDWKTVSKWWEKAYEVMPDFVIENPDGSKIVIEQQRREALQRLKKLRGLK